MPASATPLCYQSLKERHREIRGPWTREFNVRIHRALSWLRAAEDETKDADVKFILLWIGFNAAYANTINVKSKTAREEFNEFFRIMAELDKYKLLYSLVWDRWDYEIRSLLRNKFIFKSFWDNYNGFSANQNYTTGFKKANQAVGQALNDKDTSTMLMILFERLYVLRNQIVHGGSTWASEKNRDQVHDGVQVLSNLLPLFISIMMDNPNRDWGKVFYPPVDEK